MNLRESLNAKVVIEELEPIEEDGYVLCSGPDKLILKFCDYLRVNNVLTVITDKQVEQKITWVQVLSSAEATKGLVHDFAIHLATQPEENISDYWNGILPR